MAGDRGAGLDRGAWLDAARTTVAAITSLLIARVGRMPEAYWAPIIAVVVIQSSLGAALRISAERMAGTALGAMMGAILPQIAGSSLWSYGAGVFLLGVLCAVLRLRYAYRFASVTLAIIMLVPRARPPLNAAVNRFVEVTIGVLVGLGLTAIWPLEGTSQLNPPPK